MTVRCPPPPAAADLPRLRSADLIPSTGMVAVRLYRVDGAHPQSWDQFRFHGPLAGMRFDHQPPPTRDHPHRGVMYAALGGPRAGADPLDVAVLETFAERGVVPVSRGSHWLVLWRPTRRLRLLDLAGSNWLARAGGNAALMSGPRAVARRWARTIWNAYGELDGISWSSSVLPAGRSLVFFERAADAVPTHPLLHVPLQHPRLLAPLARIAEEYGLDLL